ncbi:transposase [Roseateles toxinivorans]|uniref:Transposase n=2 Tax=Roseateles toxinivorans TaxID=270368 RepID=A0A4R6QKX8_9BURK|nr:transposase [Roseateles toxinivorans]
MKTVTGIAEKAPRRQHERSFKAELVEQCLVPGASVAAIAMAGGINANLLFKWRRDHLRTEQMRGSASSSTVLVPVRVAPSLDGAEELQPVAMSPVPPPTAVATQRVVRSTGVIELDIAGAQLRLRGPVDEASLCSVLRALRQSA